ncbi:DUF1905 domain-containing protein [Demequina pelophila]|uniref:DUF1905 domain-containing protein n=1 Tax=Demequina pelophila TaxID=1638984 RepID=UPI0007851AA9|nr:DUF1905 domain-containing protein [Demequina pelophila]
MTAYEFTSVLFPWDERSDSWAFVTVPEDVADEVEDMQTGPRRGFGAVKVRVTVGGSTWDTSAFPSKERGTLVIPIKKSVRKAEGLAIGDAPLLRIELIAP